MKRNVELSTVTDRSIRKRLEALDRPIRVAITGAGAMGRGLLHQTHRTPGFACAAIADLDLDRAISSVRDLGLPFSLVGTLEEYERTRREGVVAVTEDGGLVARGAGADVLIESTSAIGPAGEFALAALESGKDLVLMNAEIDLIFGPYLREVARDRDLVYTSCDGDQHGVIKRLVDEVRLWDFELVMAGNIKGYLDRYANPTSIVPEADKRNLDYRMCTAYTDGTKLSVEMALLANALGFSVPVPGMHGPRARHVNQVGDLFDLPTLYERYPEGVVDYILGAEPGGGVFVVGYNEDPYQQEMMAYYKMGSGPFYTFYRPYHLCHVESMETVAEAVLDRRSLLEPTCGFRTNVFAYAKRDLDAGEALDGVGGYACYGMVENTAEGAHPGLPVCLADDVILRRPVRRDEPILLEDVEYDEQCTPFVLYGKSIETVKSILNETA